MHTRIHPLPEYLWVVCTGLVGRLEDFVHERAVYRSAEGHQRITAWCRSRLDRWDVPHVVGTVATGLGPTHVVQAGAAAVRDVVYLPGTNFNAATSLTLLTLLSQHCRVFAVDLPGQPGLSSPKRPQNETDAYAGWIAEVIRALPTSGPGGPVLVGHSRGAAVALSADPAQVAGLLLLNPAGLVKAAASPAVLATAVPWMARPNRRRSAALLALMTGPRHESHPEHVDWLTMVAQETRTTGAPGPLPRRLTERWRDGGVRVVSGAHDCFFLPARLVPVVRERLSVEAEVLPAVGHLTVEEATNAVLAHVLALGAGR